MRGWKSDFQKCQIKSKQNEILGKTEMRFWKSV